MRYKSGLIVLLVSLLLVTVGECFAQRGNDKDSLVRLIDAKAARLIELDNYPYRAVQGPARFFHNNTYLLCDSAVWNVNNNVIDAIGHVQIIQQDTYLVGDKLTYYSEENIAQFRGDIVKLYNKKGDQLKTRFLDYNTSDSTAYFYNGGALKSKDGQIIEGNNGRYESASRIFEFDGDVEMFSDSVFVIAERALYNSNQNKAFFYDGIVAWKERDTLFSNAAVYENATAVLTINLDNYIATENQEIWADSINYYRSSGDVRMKKNIQIQDGEQKMLLLGDSGYYQRNPSVAILTDKPVAALYSEEQERMQIKDSLGNVLRDSLIIKRDTLFTRSDTIRMWQLPMYEVDSLEIASAKKRLSLIDLDPMAEIHSNNKKYLDAYHRNKELIGKPKPPTNIPTEDEKKEGAENEEVRRDVDIGDKPKTETETETETTVGKEIDKETDEGKAEPEEVQPVDSTMVTFLSLFNDVKMHRSDVSGVCDSLIYTSLDSIARFYRNPILWNDQTSQFTSDSIQVALRNNNLYKANLFDNAMIITQEDSIHFNQIKSVEMVAYFDENDIYRFDALGGVQAMLFFRERDSSVTLMNQKECKLLSAKIVNREIQRVQYVGDIKSDMIPTYRLEIDKQRLRGFNWRKEQMPTSRYDITERSVRPSERGSLSQHIFPIYPQTKIYFPDSHKVITSLKKSIDEKIEKENREREEREREKQRERERADEAESELQKNSDEKLDFREGVEVLDQQK